MKLVIKISKDCLDKMPVSHKME